MEIKNEDISKIVESVIARLMPRHCEQIPTGVSNRHIHLSKEAVAHLFGDGYELRKFKDLKQPNQFAAQEMVTIVGPKGAIPNVRILGPARSQTQVEISRTDSFTLGVNAPVRISGDIKGSAAAVIIGPKNTLAINEGVIIAANHLHLSAEEAKKIGLANGDRITVKTTNKSRLIFFTDVIVRCGVEHLMEFHIDTDEANAAMLASGDIVEAIY